MKYPVAVIGAGVSGLTTAFCLVQHGYQVTVLDDGKPNVSRVAGALWEWPPAVCGHQYDSASTERAKGWCRVSYAKFDKLSRLSVTGVRMRRATFYGNFPVKVDEMREEGLPVESGPGLYSYLAPTVDTDVYLPWLIAALKTDGCLFIRDQASDLKRIEASYAAVVNCTGLRANELTTDCVYPVRGALIRVLNDGHRFPRINEAHCVPGAIGVGDFTFILPRGDNLLLMGGIAEPNQWEQSVSKDTIERMRQRCIDLLPELEPAEVDSVEPIRVGLRPFRDGGPRVEREGNVIHNYGHGGSGVTLSWGCAMEAAKLARESIGGVA